MLLGNTPIVYRVLPKIQMPQQHIGKTEEQGHDSRDTEVTNTSCQPNANRRKDIDAIDRLTQLDVNRHVHLTRFRRRFVTGQNWKPIHTDDLIVVIGSPLAANALV